MDISKKWIFSKSGYFQKVDIFRKGSFSESGYFQKVDIFKKWIFSKLDRLKNLYRETFYIHSLSRDTKHVIHKHLLQLPLKIVSAMFVHKKQHNFEKRF